MSEQIGPWITLACCWDIKQPTNKPQLNTWVTLSVLFLLSPMQLLLLVVVMVVEEGNVEGKEEYEENIYKVKNVVYHVNGNKSLFTILVR